MKRIIKAAVASDYFNIETADRDNLINHILHAHGETSPYDIMQITLSHCTDEQLVDIVREIHDIYGEDF